MNLLLLCLIIHSIHQNRPLVCVVQTEYQMEQRRFPRAILPDKTANIAGRKGEGDIVQMKRT